MNKIEQHKKDMRDLEQRKREVWINILNSICYADEVGNRPCDNGYICDKCRSYSYSKFYAESLKKAGLPYKNEMLFAIREGVRYGKYDEDRATLLKEECLEECKEERGTWESKDGNITLYNAVLTCRHKIVPASGGGIVCKKCGGWFCY